MKKLILVLSTILFLFGITIVHYACISTSSTTLGKQLTGKWCKPKIEIKGLPIQDLNQDEKAEYLFIMGGIEKMFEEMCIEYFDDRATGKDSYQTSISASSDDEKQNEFGEYELLANGKRLVLQTNDNQRIDIELTKLTEEEHQWRLQYADMMKLSGDKMDLPEGLPNFAMYLTFNKEK